MGKYSSVGILTKRGTSKTSTVIRESGVVGGTTTEHWDGRVDARVIPESVEVRVIQEGDK
mgnify:CR=1 FL=1|jgi:hypothetical protein